MRAKAILGLLVLVACRGATPPPAPTIPYTYPHRYTYPGAPPPPAPSPAPSPFVPPHGPPPAAPVIEGDPSFGTNHAREVGPPAGPHQAGEASYYHDSLAGNPTASGAPYDPSELTAAHRELAFGTVVDVVRSNGRWVRVTINDRGPYHGGRVIDLSRRAAKRLGLMKRGVAPVRIYIVSRAH